MARISSVARVQNAKVIKRPTTMRRFAEEESVQARAAQGKKQKKKRLKQRFENDNEVGLVADRLERFGLSSDAKLEAADKAVSAAKAAALKAVGPYILGGAGIFYIIIFMFGFSGLAFQYTVNKDIAFNISYADIFSTDVGTYLTFVAMGFAAAAFGLLIFIFDLFGINVTKGKGFALSAFVFGFSVAPISQLFPWQLLWAGAIIFFNKKGLKALKK